MGNEPHDGYYSPMVRASLTSQSVFIVIVLTVLTACSTPQRFAQKNEPGSFKTYMAIGNVAFENHEWSLARECFLFAHDEAPENSEAVKQFAMTNLLEGKDLRRARWMIEQALPAASPADTLALLDIQARIALRQGRYADARTVLEQVQALDTSGDPDFPDLSRDNDNTLAQVPH